MFRKLKVVWFEWNRLVPKSTVKLKAQQSQAVTITNYHVSRVVASLTEIFTSLGLKMEIILPIDFFVCLCTEQKGKRQSVCD